jgi:hypothetical protein
MAGLHTMSSGSLGFLIDSTTWLHLPEQARKNASHHHELTRLALLRSGWRVIPTRHGDALATLWHQAGARRAEGFAYRAPMAETVSRTGM